VTVTAGGEATVSVEISISSIPVRRQRATPRNGSDVSTSPAWSYALLSPFVLVYVAFVLIPILFGIVLSFMKWDGVGAPQFIGLANFQALATNRRVLAAFGNLFYFVALEVPIAVVTGLSLALFVDRFSLRVATVIRAVLLLPFIMPLFLTAAIWQWMLVPQFGLFNQLTAVFGLGNVEWLSNPRYMIPGLVIVETWRSAGFNMVLFYAGLKAIPIEQYEAARIDGANTFQEIGFVLLPQLAPITFIITVNAMFGTFQIFDLPWLLSKSGFVEGQGGAGGGLLFPVMQSVAYGFGSLRFGQAAAIGVVLLLLIITVTGGMFAARTLLRRRNV
jgi:multiple sugar transport system permease protein